MNNLMWFVGNKTPSYKEIIIKSFISGTFWALGTAIGAGIVLALLSFLVDKTSGIPFLGKIIHFVINEIKLYNTK